jgi:MFS family permease
MPLIRAGDAGLLVAGQGRVMRAAADPQPTVPAVERSRSGPLAALRYPGYRLLTAGTTPHMLSMQMSTVAMGYLAYQLSGSATALGFIGLGWGLPMLVLSLVGGVVADRFPRRTIVLGTQAMVGASAAVGAALLLTGVIQIWHIFLLALMQGTAFAFNMPARQALIAELVGPADLGSAIALNNTLMNAARVLGPPIAGVLIGAPAVGINGLYVLMASIYVVVLLTLWRLPRTAGPARAGRRSGRQDLVAGLRFIGGSPALIGLLALGFAPMFFGMPHQLLLPVFALGILQAGPEGLGLLNMASGLGAVVGSVLVAFVAVGRQRAAQVALGLLFGAGLIGFALSGGLLPAALLLALVGAASAGYMSLNNSLIMEATPKEFHGRVMSVYMMTWALMPLASLPAARLADQIGAATTVAWMGALLIVAVLAVTLWQRRVAAGTADRVAGAPAD